MIPPVPILLSSEEFKESEEKVKSSRHLEKILLQNLR